MANIDLEMGQFQKVTTLENKDYIVVSLDNGTQGQIKVSDLASVVAGIMPNGTFRIAHYYIPTLKTYARKICSFIVQEAYYNSMIQINAVGFDGCYCGFIMFRNIVGNFTFYKKDLFSTANIPGIYILRNGNLFDVYISGTYLSTYSHGGTTIITSDDMVSFANTGQEVLTDNIKDSSVEYIQM